MRVSDKKLFEAEVFNSDTKLSESVELEHIYGFAVFAKWVGATTTGTAKLQASVNNSDWEDLAGLTEAISGPGSVLWNVPEAMYRYFRLSVESTNGNNITLDAEYYAKGQ